MDHHLGKRKFDVVLVNFAGKLFPNPLLYESVYSFTPAAAARKTSRLILKRMLQDHESGKFYTVVKEAGSVTYWHYEVSRDLPVAWDYMTDKHKRMFNYTSSVRSLGKSLSSPFARL